MSINFPSTRKEVTDRIKSDVQSQLPESNPYLRNSFIQALIYAYGGRIYDIYRTQQLVLEQMFFDTATDEYLERMASWFGITKIAATQSEGYITITGTNGTPVPALTSFQSTDGIELQTQALVTITTSAINISVLTQTGGVATATTASDHGFAPNMEVIVSGANETEYNGTVTILSVPDSDQFTYSVDAGAVSPATGTIIVTATSALAEVQSVDTGQDANLSEGEGVTITSAIAGVDDTAYVSYGGLEGGADQETDTELKTRFLFRVQNPVALFNNSAIEVQAKEIAGVTRVWVFNVDTTQGNLTASSLTSASQVAIFTVAAGHGLNDGDKVTVTGANEAEYNVSKEPTIILDSTRFAYAISGTPATPATGTPVAAYSLVQEGQVITYFVRDNDASIIPGAAEIAAVKNNILEIKPAHMSDDDVIVQAPIPVTTNFTIASIYPDSTAMREAVEASLEAFFADNTEVGEDVLEIEYESAILNSVEPNTNQRIQTFTISAPSGDITIDRGELAILGTVTFL